MLDISNSNFDRFFVVGNLLGSYDKLINILYYQEFSYKDALVLTGNFIHNEVNKSIDCFEFIKNNDNCFSVIGRNEVSLLLTDNDNIPVWLKSYPNIDNFKNFITELPLIIKIYDYFFVINSGIDYSMPLEEQEQEVFYSIGKYDKDSKYYYNKDTNMSWYDIDYSGTSFCFSNVDAGRITVPAGYCLYRDVEDPLRCVIYKRGELYPKIIQE